MNAQTEIIAAGTRLRKVVMVAPCLVAPEPHTLAIGCSLSFGGRDIAAHTSLALPRLEAGGDYVVRVGREAIDVALLTSPPEGDDVLGGIHFAPGGNAVARAGGDSAPAFNPHSAWDQNFRPVVADPRGMTLVSVPDRTFWCDIYLLGADHTKNGTSAHGVIIADHNDPPQRHDGGRFTRLDYETAVTVMAQHGKQLLGLDEFFAAAFGVTERTAHRGDPKITKLDAPRTSKFGLMQATGSLWVWGHDNDPDKPRASLFGGSWFNDDNAGSRYANVGYWPGHSDDNLGARGRCDHLQHDGRRDSAGAR